jgi:hypothetical protein
MSSIAWPRNLKVTRWFRVNVILQDPLRLPLSGVKAPSGEALHIAEPFSLFDGGQHRPEFLRVLRRNPTRIALSEKTFNSLMPETHDAHDKTYGMTVREVKRSFTSARGRG